MKLHVTPHRRPDQPVPGCVALTGCSEESGAAGGGAEAGGCAPEDVQLVGQVRNESNPYEAAWLDGGDAFAE